MARWPRHLSCSCSWTKGSATNLHPLYFAPPCFSLLFYHYSIFKHLKILENTEVSKWCKTMTKLHANFCWEIRQVAMGNTLRGASALWLSSSVLAHSLLLHRGLNRQSLLTCGNTWTGSEIPFHRVDILYLCCLLHALCDETPNPCKIHMGDLCLFLQEQDTIRIHGNRPWY